MSLLSDVDIRKALGKDIVIEPFAEELLTPIGYDFTVGEYVFSLEYGLLEIKGGSYQLPPKSTIQILTKESLWVSGKIGGTFHSKVSLVSKGLSHISTTLDPGWYGPLLITFRNNTDNILLLKSGDSFVTLVFSQLKTPTKSPHNKPQSRQDILVAQLKEQEQNYIDKIAGVINNKNISATFATSVVEANRPIISKIIISIQMNNKDIIFRLVYKTTVMIAIIAVSLLSFYWDIIKVYFHGLPYDSKIMTMQFPVIIGLVALYNGISKK